MYTIILDRGKVKDVRIPNNVYNKLKQHAQSDSKKDNTRLHEKKEHSTSVSAGRTIMCIQNTIMWILDCFTGV